jgi:hypothetical protein
MKRSWTRGGLVWIVMGVLVYACTGDDRQFVDPGGDEGGAGAGESGGASGSAGRGGASGSSGSGTSGDAGGPAGDGGSAGSGTSGSGGTTDPGGAGGEAGEPEPPEPPPPPGRPGTALVAGGKYMSSANYKMFIVNGNGSLRVTSSSANYRLHGGIVGTTQP